MPDDKKLHNVFEAALNDGVMSWTAAENEASNMGLTATAKLCHDVAGSLAREANANDEECVKND